MSSRPPSATRKRIAAAGVLVIVVAIVVALFQVAGDLRESRRASGVLIRQNGAQLEQLDALDKTNDELRDLIKRQAAVLEGLVDDNVEPALRQTAAELAALSARILDSRATGTSSTATSTTPTPAAPGAQRPIVVQTTPGPAGPRGETGPPGAAAPRPSASPPPSCTAEVLRVCLFP